MDAQYVKETVGEALIEALDQVLDKQPADPIEYLGLMLLQYIKNQEGKPEEFKKRVFNSYQLPAKDDKAKQSLALENKLTIEQQNDKFIEISSTEGQSERIADEVDVTETSTKQLENGVEGKDTKEIKEENSMDQVEVIPITQTGTLSTGVDALVGEIDTDNTTHGVNENGDIQGNPTTSEEPAMESADMSAVSADSNINTAEAMDSIHGREDSGITHQEPTETQSEDVESTMPAETTE